MTREEALQILDTIPTIGEQVEALEMAISALSQEPITDRIEYGTDGNAYKLWISNGKEYEPSGDLISRQLAIDTMTKLEQEDIDTYGCSIPEGFDGERAIEALKQLPPVKPQEPKTGHWIEKDGFDGDVYYDCSECGESWTTIEGTPWDNEWNYCPNCGARMVEPQESEDKE